MLTHPIRITEAYSPQARPSRGYHDFVTHFHLSDGDDKDELRLFASAYIESRFSMWQMWHGWSEFAKAFMAGWGYDSGD